MRPHRPMYTGTAYTQKHPPVYQPTVAILRVVYLNIQIPRGPPRICEVSTLPMLTEPSKLGVSQKHKHHVPFFLQSAQFLLSGCLTSSRKVRALRSMVALSSTSLA